jgi:hypothetical protein
MNSKRRFDSLRPLARLIAEELRNLLATEGLIVVSKPSGLRESNLTCNEEKNTASLDPTSTSIIENLSRNRGKRYYEKV